MRRWLRKHAPTREQVEGSRWLRPLGFALTRPGVWYLNRRSAALGVAIGLLTGLLPGPTQLLSAAALSVWLRANLPTAMLTTLYTNPLTIVPLYWLAYQIGARVTGETGSAPPMPDFDAANIAGFVAQTGDWVWSLGDSLVIGLLLQGWLFACLGYLAVIGAWRWSSVRRWQQRRSA